MKYEQEFKVIMMLLLNKIMIISEKKGINWKIY